jgi:hypothetical protein
MAPKDARRVRLLASERTVASKRSEFMSLPSFAASAQ